MEKIEQPKIKMKNKKLRESFRSRPCIICRSVPSDPCHLKTYASTLSDDEFNIFELCRTHHVEMHKIGTFTFIEKYPTFKKSVINKGWKIETVFGKKILSRC